MYVSMYIYIYIHIHVIIISIIIIIHIYIYIYTPLNLRRSSGRCNARSARKPVQYAFNRDLCSEFRDVVFEDVAFDNSLNLILYLDFT